MRYLLDVNLFLAAIWSKLDLHAQANAWLADKQVALCPIAELGFVRISSHRRAFGYAMPDVRHGLQAFAAGMKADWIADDLPVLSSAPRTSDQVTDHYRADLAAKHGLKLATLDAQLKHPAVELIS